MNRRPGRKRGDGKCSRPGFIGATVDPAIIARLDTFCSKHSFMPLTRSCMVELAIVRFLDQLQDDPSKLFHK